MFTVGPRDWGKEAGLTTRLWKVIWNKKRNINICVFIKLVLNGSDEMKYNNNNEESLATLEVHTRRSKPTIHRDTMLFTEDFVGPTVT